jgi:N-acetylglucosamine-6-phosphate deacetylase
VAVRLATLNAARAIGLEATHGRVEVGRRADLAIVDDDWEVLATIAGGVLAYRADAGGNVAVAGDEVGPW